MNNKRILLVTGCQRSGTSLLASLLGAHPEIAMMESAGNGEFKQFLGKKYCGVKLTIPRQIRLTQRASRFGHVVNKLANTFNKDPEFMRYRPFPISKYSLNDFADMGAKIITINRNPGSIIKSMKKRGGYNSQAAIDEFNEYNVTIRVFETQYSILKVVFNQLLPPYTENTLNQICRYLAIDYSPLMLQGYKYNADIYNYDGILKEKA